ncbi:hypothetical protein BGZ72_004043, partial [Mortierella alpina]
IMKSPERKERSSGLMPVRDMDISPQILMATVWESMRYLLIRLQFRWMGSERLKK